MPKPIRDSITKRKKTASVADATVAAEGLRPRGTRRPGKPLTKPMSRSHPPVHAVMERASDMGLMTANSQLVGARLPMELLEQAKKRTGIASTTDLLAFALANVAVEDNFATSFVAARGKLDPDLDIGF